MPRNQPAPWSSRRLANFAGISEITLKRWIEAGYIAAKAPAVRGRSYEIPDEEAQIVLALVVTCTTTQQLTRQLKLRRQPPAANGRPYLDAREAAAKLKISLATLEYWGRRGYISPLKQNGIQLYDPEYIDRWNALQNQLPWARRSLIAQRLQSGKDLSAS